MLIKPNKKKIHDGCVAYRKLIAGQRTYCAKKRTCVTRDDCEWCDDRPKAVQERDVP